MEKNLKIKMPHKPSTELERECERYRKIISIRGYWLYKDEYSDNDNRQITLDRKKLFEKNKNKMKIKKIEDKSYQIDMQNDSK